MSEALLLEKWKSIPGYPKYEASNLGNIRNKKTLRVLKPKDNHNNHYLEVKLYDKTRSVHRLIALTFLTTENTRLFINHIDSDRHNNRVTNLEWCTASENSVHMSKQGNANGGKKKVKVRRYTLDGKLDKTYKTMTDAVNDGFDDNAIRAHVKNGKPYKGYIWKKENTKIKQINQFTIHGELIDHYASVSEVIKTNPDMCLTTLHKAARGERKTYRGYIWKYV